MISSRQPKPVEACYMREHVISIEHIAQLARAGRACYHLYSGVMPAAVLLNMRASLLLRWIKDENLYIYPKRGEAFTKQRKRRTKLPSWCTPGQLVYWPKSGQNHTITSIRGGKVWFTPGRDYPGYREWCNRDQVGQLQPVGLLAGGAK